MSRRGGYRGAPALAGVALPAASLAGYTPNVTLSQRIVAAEQAIRGAGFDLRYVEWCEDDRTPGILGYYGAVTDRRFNEVKVAVGPADRRVSAFEVVIRLEHELHHVSDPQWVCGNGPVL